MYLGIDIGSVSTNAVIVNKYGEIIAYEVMPSGYHHKETIAEISKLVCQKANISPKKINKIIGTGYGRRNIPGTYKVLTEITCHAIGVKQLYQNVETIIDIGGQDSKFIKLSKDGVVEDFTMNDKCSAGTGRFLEVMSRVMEMDMDEFSRCGLTADHIYRISNTCTVFAESEIISGVSKGIKRNEIVAGIYQSIVDKIMNLAGNIDYNGNIVLTGGVAKNTGVFSFLKQKMPNITVPFEPQITGALGAALAGCINEQV